MRYTRMYRLWSAALIGAVGATTAALLIGAAGPTTSLAARPRLRPVPSELITMINKKGGPTFQPTSTSPRVSKSSAVAIALAKSPVAGRVTGISLFRASNISGLSGTNQLVWVISIRPAHPIYQAGGVATTPATPTATASEAGHRAASYYVSVVDATTGQWVAATSGYSPTLP